MPGGNLEEETYSLIFASLRHPIRRRILRMLARERSFLVSGVTFSEMLESLSIDSGHLSYHLEKMGDLLTRSHDGKYGLSSVGIAAVKLMTRVEDHPAIGSSLKVQQTVRAKITEAIVNLYPLVLLGALVLASLYFVNFTVKSDSGIRFGSSVPGMVRIPANQTFEHNITMVYQQGSAGNLLSINGSVHVERGPLGSTLTAWNIGWLRFNIKANESFEMSRAIYGSNGIVLPDAIMHMAGGTGTNLYVDVTRTGTYRLLIKNVGSEDIHPIITWDIWWEHFEKPYFYYGIAGLTIALLYPILVVFRILKRAEIID